MHLRSYASRHRLGQHLRLEQLEDRRLLAITPLGDKEQAAQQAAIDFHGPDLVGKDGPLARLGGELTLLYNQFLVNQQRHPGQAFTWEDPALNITNNRVLADVVTTGNMGSFKTRVRAIGGEITAEAGELITVRLPIDALDNLAGLTGLGFARPAWKPITRVGATTSQGDFAMQSDVARTQFGVDGTGVSIGVLSDSYNRRANALTNAAADIASGDLPSNGVQIVEELSTSSPITPSDEGRAMLQLIHDVAPGADLLFATAGESEAEFAENIRRLRTAGADVIVDDVGFFAEPYFQDGLVAQAANEVAEAGVPYFSSAGNNATDGYESAFRDSGQTLPGGAKLHDFDPGPGVDTLQSITIPAFDVFQLILQWDQPFGSLPGTPSSQSDVDIELLNAAGTVVVESSTDNNVGGDPIERLVFLNLSTVENYTLRISSVSGTLPSVMKYLYFDDFGEVTIDEYDTQTGASWGHPMAASVAGVAASAFYLTPEYNVTPPRLNEFSSAGGTKFYFTDAGVAIPGGEARMQPRFTGPDGTNTTFFGSDIPASLGNDTDTFGNFFGTSAAAPHLAAVTALMIDRAGGPGELTSEEVYQFMADAAIDILQRVDESAPNSTPITIPNGVGFDIFSGWGFVDAQQAVRAIPAPPRAVPDSVTTPINTPITIDVLENDVPSDPLTPLDPTTVTITRQPAHGSVTVDPVTGKVTYTPDTGFVGTDSFLYTVEDTAGAVSNPARVTIRVNRPPVAVDDSATTTTDTPVVIPVLANDSDDPPGTLAPATVNIVDAPANGTTSINTTTGAVTYTPDPGFFGDDTFTYTVDDNDGATSNIATVSIFVNAPPVAVDDTANTEASTPVSIPVLANDDDPNEGGFLVPSTVTIVSAAGNGTTSINRTTGVVTYTPDDNFSGTDTFTYTVKDNNGATSNEATVTITVNATPVAIDDFANTAIGTPVTINVITPTGAPHDYDLDGTIVPATLEILSQPANGFVTEDNLGNVTYTPNAGFEGGDRIVYRVADNRGVFSNPATVVFRVGLLNSISGKVFADLNNDGDQDAGEFPIEGVTVFIEKTDGPFTYTDLYVTDANGNYTFTELVKGVYTIREQHPGFFVDGQDTAGTVAPDSTANDTFVGITLAGGVNATGYNFGERGLRAEFAAAYMSRNAYLASGDGASFDGINLGLGEAFVSLDGGINGQLNAFASANKGPITLSLYNNSMTLVKRVNGGSSASLTYSTASTDTYFLKLSGTASNASLSSFVVRPTTPTTPTVPTTPTTSSPTFSWHNSSFAEDVDGDDILTSSDALMVIDAIKRAGAGSLTTRSLPTSYGHLDVNGDNLLTASDALMVIDTIKRQSVPRTASAAQSASQTSATSVSDDVAFAFAVDQAISEMESASSTKSKTRRRL